MGELLYIAHRIPYPPDRGDKIRSWHMLKHMAGMGRVHLACFADDEADAAHLPALRAAIRRALPAQDEAQDHRILAEPAGG